MDITIRLAEMDDVPALKELIPLSARELSKGYYTSEQTESMIKYIIGVDTQLIIDPASDVNICLTRVCSSVCGEMSAIRVSRDRWKSSEACLYGSAIASLSARYRATPENPESKRFLSTANGHLLTKLCPLIP